MNSTVRVIRLVQKIQLELYLLSWAGRELLPKEHKGEGQIHRSKSDVFVPLLYALSEGVHGLPRKVSTTPIESFVPV